MSSRSRLVAALIAVLGLTGCLGGGPSGDDVAAVEAALANFAPDWTAVSISKDGSESEGWDHNLGVLVSYEARVTDEALLDLFEAITSALPASYRWRVSIVVVFGPDLIPVDLTRVTADLNMDASKRTFYETGGIPTTVKELLAILEANGR